ncbi:MAG: hypothetical protein ACRDYC_10770 [Acidimicrobiales bacterium]
MRRWKFAGVLACGAVAGLLATGAAAWACVPTAILNLAGVNEQAGWSTTAQVGDTVNVTGQSFGKAPVVLHFNAIDGPVLTTITPAAGFLTGSFVVPAGTASGDYVVIATEAATTGSQLWGIPTRALLAVGSGGQAAPQPSAGPLAPRATTLARSGSEVAPLLLTGLGAAAVALMITGLAVYMGGSRRSSVAETEAVSSGSDS